MTTNQTIDVHNERLIASLRERVKELEAAQPQGEPVAWATNRGGVLELFNSEREALDDLKEWRKNAPLCDVSVGPMRLYAEQPAPVAVVLPERKDRDGFGEFSPHSNGWNACLDEVKRLNPK